MPVLIHACFFLSGFSSLAYELLWTRTLTHVIGGSPYAVSVILTLFMAGLGLGAYLGGRLADHRPGRARLLSTYGWLEAAIGLYALGLPALLAVARPVFAALYAGLYRQAFAYHLAVFLLAGLLLLLPVLCMGATLPLLGRLLVQGISARGGPLGFLYALNTLGAAAGVLATGFWLFPALGLRGATCLAAGINLLVGAACIAAARRMGREAAAPAAFPAPRSVPPVARWAALSVFGISGFCALACEVIWTKVLGLIMGPSPYAFTLVLATFIAGLALGAWAFSRIADKLPNPAAALALSQGAAAFLALAAGQRMGNSLFLFEKIAYLLPDRFGAALAAQGACLAAFMFLPTFCLGGAFPLVMRICGGGEGVGRSLGSAYAVNTLGGVLGAWCAGFLLVPALGSESSLSLVAGLQAASALAFYGAGWLRGRTSWPRWAGAAAAAALATWLCALYPSWPREELSRAAGRPQGPVHRATPWWDAFWNRAPVPVNLGGQRLEFYGDGIGGFTSVWKTANPLGQEELSLYLSGKPDASSRKDMFTQVLLAQVPMLLHPDPRAVMVLGLASGVTAGEVLHYPVRSLDVLEINPQVPEAAALFRPYNNGVLEDGRTRLILQDAKAHLLLGGQSYDVIISEPSNPWMAGLAELFTREFLRRAEARLSEGGIMVQFLHSYQMDWETFALVGRTFAEVFPNSMLIRTMPDDRPETGANSDFLLVGRKGEAPFRLEDRPEKHAALARSRNLKLASVRLLGRLVAAENLAEVFGPGPLHTDDRPLLEFVAPRLRMTFASRAIEAQIALRRRLREETRALVDSLRNDAGARLDYADFAFSLFKPFPGMLDHAGAAESERIRFLEQVKQYCGSYFLPDLYFLEEGAPKTLCSSVQMAALNRRLQAGYPGGEIYLAMAFICWQNNVPGNAVKFYRQALESGGEHSAVGRIARNEITRIMAELGDLQAQDALPALP